MEWNIEDLDFSKSCKTENLIPSTLYHSVFTLPSKHHYWNGFGNGIKRQNLERSNADAEKDTLDDDDEYTFYTFGGINEDYNLSNDILEIKKKKGSITRIRKIQVNSDDIPCPRAHHTLISWSNPHSSNSLASYSESCTSPKIPLQKPAKTINMEANTMKKKLQEKMEYEEDEQSVSELSQTSKNGTDLLHQADEYNECHFILFGGYDGTFFLNDLWILTVYKPCEDKHRSFYWKRINFDEMDHTKKSIYNASKGLPIAETTTATTETSKSNRGSKPCERCEHTSCIIEKNDQRYMYVFGGYNEETKALNDLWALDLETFTWNLIDQGKEKPSPRYGHCSISFDISSFSTSTNLVLDDSSKHFKMICFFGYNDHGLTQGKTPLLSGLPPRILKNRVFSSLVSNYLNDVWIFDVQTNKWSKIKFSHCPYIAGRYQSSACYIGNGCIFLFGGYQTSNFFSEAFLVDILQNKCMLVPHIQSASSNGKWPIARHGHASTFYRKGREIILFGGKKSKKMKEKSEILKDICIINIDQLFRILNIGKVDTRFKQYYDNMSSVKISLLPKSGTDQSRKPGEHRSKDALLTTIKKETLSLEQNSKNIKSILSRADAYFELHLYTKAMEDFQAAVQLNPDALEHKLKVPICEYKLENFVASTSNLDQIIQKLKQKKQNFNSSEKLIYLTALRYKAKAMFKLRQIEGSLRICNEIMEFFPLLDQKKEKTNKKLQQDPLLMIHVAISCLKLTVKSWRFRHDFENCFLTIEKMKTLIKNELKLEKTFTCNITQIFSSQHVVSVKDYLNHQMNRLKQKEIELRQQHSDYQESTKYLIEGREKVKNKQYKDAVSLFIKASVSDPQNFHAQLEISQCYGLMKNYASAIYYSKLAIQTNPFCIEAFISLANCYLANRKLAKSEKTLKNAIEQCSLLEDAEKQLNLLKQIETLQKNVSQKKTDIEQAIHIGGQAIFLKSQMKLFESLQQFNVALTLDDQNIPLLCERSKLLTDMRQYEQAISDASTAIKLAPTQSYGYIALSRIYIKLHRYKYALPVIEECMKQDMSPSILRMYNNLNIHIQNKKKADVLTNIVAETFQTKLFCYTPIKQIQVGHCIVIANEKEKEILQNCLSKICRSIKLYPRGKRALINRAHIYFTLHKFKKCIEDVFHLLQLFGEDQQVYDGCEMAEISQKSYHNVENYFENVMIGMHALAMSHKFDESMAFTEMYKLHKRFNPDVQAKHIEQLNHVKKLVNDYKQNISNFKENWNQAKTFSNDGNHSKAIEYYSKAIEDTLPVYLTPLQLATLYFEYSESLFMTNYRENIDKSSSLVDRSITLFTTPHAVSLKVIILCRQNRIEEAEKICATTLSNSFPFNSKLNDLHLTVKRYKRKMESFKFLEQAKRALSENLKSVAIGFLNNSIDLCPYNAEAYLYRSKVNLELRHSRYVVNDTSFMLDICEKQRNNTIEEIKKQKSNAHLTKELQIEQNVIDDLIIELSILKGQALLNLRQTDEAKLTFMNGMKLQSNHKNLMTKYKECMNKEKKIREAEDYYKLALEAENRDNKAAFAREKAIELISRAINLDQYSMYYIKRCKLYISLLQIDKALKDADTAIELGENEVESYNAKILCLIEKNDFDEAQRLLDDIIKLESKNEGLLQLSNDLKTRESNFKDSLKKYQDAQEMMKKGKPQSALPLLLQAKSAFPFYLPFSACHIECLVMMKKLSEAEYQSFLFIAMYHDRHETYELCSQLQFNHLKDLDETLFTIVLGLEIKPRHPKLIHLLSTIIGQISSLAETDNRLIKASTYEHHLDESIGDLFIEQNGMIQSLSSILDDEDMNLVTEIGEQYVNNKNALKKTDSGTSLLSEGKQESSKMKHNSSSPDSKSLNAIQIVYSAFSKYTKEFTLNAYEIMKKLKMEAFLYSLRAYAVRNAEITGDRLKKVQKLFNLGIELSEKEINEKMWKSFSKEKFIKNCIFLPQLKEIEMDRHPIYPSKSFQLKTHYEIWKNKRLQLINEIVSLHPNIQNIPEDKSIEISLHNHHSMLRLILNSIILEQPKEHVIDDLFLDMLVTIGHAYGLGSTYVLLQAIDKYTSRTPIQAASIIKVMSLVIKIIVNRFDALENISSTSQQLTVSHSLSVSSNSLVGIFLTSAEKKILKNILSKLDSYITLTGNLHYRAFADSNLPLILKMMTRIFCMLRIMDLFSEVEDYNPVPSTKLAFETYVSESCKNFFNFIKNRTQVTSNDVDCSYFHHLCKAVSQMMDIYSLCFGNILPKSINFLRIASKTFHSLFQSEIQKQTKICRAATDHIQQSKQIEPLDLNPNIIFQIPQQIHSLYRTFSVHAPSIEPLSFEAENMVVPYVFILLRFHEIKMKSWVSRAVELDTWKPLNIGSNHIFTSSVVDVFTAIQEALQFTNTICSFMIAKNSSSGSSYSDDEDEDLSFSEKSTATANSSVMYSITNLKLIYHTFGDMVRTLVLDYASQLKILYKQEILKIEQLLKPLDISMWGYDSILSNYPTFQSSMDKICFCICNLHGSISKLEEFIHDSKNIDDDDGISKEIQHLQLMIQNIQDCCHTLQEYKNKMIDSLVTTILMIPIQESFNRMFHNSKNATPSKMQKGKDVQIEPESSFKQHTKILFSSMRAIFQLARYITFPQSPIYLNLMNRVFEEIILQLKERIIADEKKQKKLTPQEIQLIQGPLYEEIDGFFIGKKEFEGISRHVVKSERIFLDQLIELSGKPSLYLADLFTRLTSEINQANYQKIANNAYESEEDYDDNDLSEEVKEIADKKSAIVSNTVSLSSMPASFQEKKILRNYIFAILNFRSSNSNDNYASQIVKNELMSNDLKNMKTETEQQLQQDSMKELQAIYFKHKEEIQSLESDLAFMLKQYFFLKELRTQKMKAHKLRADNKNIKHLIRKYEQEYEETSRQCNFWEANSEKELKKIEETMLESQANINVNTIEHLLANTLGIGSQQVRIEWVEECLYELNPGYLIACRISKIPCLYWLSNSKANAYSLLPREKYMLLLPDQIAEVTTSQFGGLLENAINIHMMIEPVNNGSTETVIVHQFTSIRNRDQVLEKLSKFVQNNQNTPRVQQRFIGDILGKNIFGNLIGKMGTTTQTATQTPIQMKEVPLKGYIVSSTLKSKFKLDTNDRLAQMYSCYEHESGLPGNLYIFTSCICFDVLGVNSVSNVDSVHKMILHLHQISKVSKNVKTIRVNNTTSICITDKNGKNFIYSMMAVSPEEAFSAIHDVISDYKTEEKTFYIVYRNKDLMLVRHNVSETKKKSSGSFVQKPFKILNSIKVLKKIEEGGEEVAQFVQDSNDRLLKFLNPKRKHHNPM